MPNLDGALFNAVCLKNPPGVALFYLQSILFCQRGPIILIRPGINSYGNDIDCYKTTVSDDLNALFFSFILAIFLCSQNNS